MQAAGGGLMRSTADATEMVERKRTRDLSMVAAGRITVGEERMMKSNAVG